jgi:hypothetical protein
MLYREFAQLFRVFNKRRTSRAAKAIYEEVRKIREFWRFTCCEKSFCRRTAISYAL